jgi:Ca2+-dependent lipid-binding protein
LVVTVIECESLSDKEYGGPPDPYVTIRMSSKRKVKYQTTVQWQTHNPKFNESFVFRDVTLQSFAVSSVYFRVLDFKYGKNVGHRVIGEVDFSIEKVDERTEVDTWQFLSRPGDRTQVDLGDVLFSLKFQPVGGRLMVITVTLMKAKNLETVMPKGKLGATLHCYACKEDM